MAPVMVPLLAAVAAGGFTLAGVLLKAAADALMARPKNDTDRAAQVSREEGDFRAAILSRLKEVEDKLERRTKEVDELREQNGVLRERVAGLEARFRACPAPICPYARVTATDPAVPGVLP